MFRLTIVAGPDAGKSFELREGENPVGRQSNNVIPLRSGKVSKVHCVLTVNGDTVFVEDQGSSNGTFVNGVLTREKEIDQGDRISVGEFVLELAKARKKKPRKRSSGKRGNTNAVVLDFPNQTRNVPAPGSPAPPVSVEAPAGNRAPTDFKGKVLWGFEHYVMPFFFGLNLKNEWRSIGAGLLVCFIVATLVISIFPLLQANRTSVISEIARRANFMARQIADQNAVFLAKNAETKTSIGLAEDAYGVRFAVLIDLQNRIIAPGSKMNQTLAAGGAANLAVRASKAFRDGREKGITREVGGETLVAIQPLKVLNPKTGRNEVIAMSVVAVDTTLSTLDWGTIGVVYANAFVLTFLLAAFLAIVFYRLTLKRFDLLNEDIDKVLRGEPVRITRDFKFRELDGLWDVIESALERLPKATADGMPAENVMAENFGVDQVLEPLRMMGEQADFGMLVFDEDKKIAYLNSVFEELSGIRFDSAMGQDIASVAREESLTSLCEDLIDQVAQNPMMPATEDYDFSGMPFKVQVSAIGTDRVKGFVLMAKREDA